MRKRILIMEKDEDILQIIRDILEQEGYLVILHRTEEGVLEHIIREQPDLILLDVIKPTEEGNALCNTIKRIESTEHIPIIILSTHPQIRNLNIECADDIIDKPFDVSALITAVKEHLEV